MRVDVLRRRFPEYGDLSDIEFCDIISSLLSEISGEANDTFAPVVNAPKVEQAVIDVVTAVDGVGQLMDTLLSNVNKSIKALDKPEKEEKDISPHFMALAVQLSKIEAAVKAIEIPMMEPMQMPEMKMCKGFKIMRDELGNIDRVIPEY